MQAKTHTGHGPAALLPVVRQLNEYEFGKALPPQPLPFPFGLRGDVLPAKLPAPSTLTPRLATLATAAGC